MFRKLLTIASLVIIVLLLLVGSKRIELPFNIGSLAPLQLGQIKQTTENGQVRVVTEESVTIEVVKKVTPAVVTVGITKNQPVFDFNEGFFGPFGFSVPQERGTRQVKQDIGTGFIVRNDGLIVTNKHVVGDSQAKYRVITSDNKTYDAVKIYPDPNLDLAIIKIDAAMLQTVEMGDSSNLQVGQFALAIGTALGEFRSTVTTGVVSGIGRDITAGSPMAGSEELSDIIQTSAPINPGNSGGPLLNSAGQVIGVNVAVAQNAQNIGFALPVNLVKEALKNFETTGGFAPKAYLGVSYRMISRELAILNEVPEGAYVQEVVLDSPAETAGVEQGDIITKIDGKMVRDADGGLAKKISTKKPKDIEELTVYRGAETKSLKVTLSESQ